MQKRDCVRKNQVPDEQREADPPGHRQVDRWSGRRIRQGGGSEEYEAGNKREALYQNEQGAADEFGERSPAGISQKKK